MKTIAINFNIQGIEVVHDINIPVMLNQMKESNPALFIENVLDIFSNLDFSGIELKDHHKVILKPNMIILNDKLNFKASDIACAFFEWAIDAKVNYDLPDFETKTIFNEFIKSLNEKTC